MLLEASRATTLECPPTWSAKMRQCGGLCSAAAPCPHGEYRANSMAFHGAVADKVVPNYAGRWRRRRLPDRMEWNGGTIDELRRSPDA